MVQGSDGMELKHMIWQIVASVPMSKVATYGQIARLCGYPSHSRYVGTVLKNLPSDSLLPWHRIINSRGEISFPNSSPSYLRQRALLEGEGVIFAKNGRVRLSVFQWDA